MSGDLGWPRGPSETRIPQHYRWQELTWGCYHLFMVLELYSLDTEFSRVSGTWNLIIQDGSFIDDLIFFFPWNNIILSLKKLFTINKPFFGVRRMFGKGECFSQWMYHSYVLTQGSWGTVQRLKPPEWHVQNYMRYQECTLAISNLNVPSMCR